MNYKTCFGQLLKQNYGILFSLFLLLIVGCKLEGDGTALLNSDEEIRDRVTYFMDSRTGLCFAQVDFLIRGDRGVSITCVPCDSIKRLSPYEYYGKERNQKR